MKISIITATYNSAATISSCIASVNEQTYPDIEHIIIDGASKDNTLEIIKSMPNRISKIVSEPDDGIYDALNTGIQLASGDIIGFLHADDIFFSGSILQKIADSFDAFNTDGIYGNNYLVQSENINKIVRIWSSKPFSPKFLNYGWMPPHPALFLKESVYKKHGVFDLSFKISSDYDFILRIFKDQDLKYAYIPETITKMRVGGASNGSFKKFIQKTREDYIALKKNNISNPFIALFSKKISKISQYF